MEQTENIDALVKKRMADYDRQLKRKQLFIVTAGDPSRYHDDIVLQDTLRAGEWKLLVDCLSPERSLHYEGHVRIKDRNELEAFLTRFITANYPVVFLKKSPQLNLRL